MELTDFAITCNYSLPLVITNQRLHVITARFCNYKALITRNYMSEAVIRLQETPVITCNRGVVIAPLVMDPAASLHFATRSYRETNVSLSITCTTAEENGDPVMPPRDPFKETLARQPKTCPRCGSREIAPTFEGRQWDCRCTYEWEA